MAFTDLNHLAFIDQVTILERRRLLAVAVLEVASSEDSLLVAYCVAVMINLISVRSKFAFALAEMTK